MENDYVRVIFNLADRNEKHDLDIPLNISAYELMVSLNSAFELGVDVSNVRNCFLSAERPIALLRGELTLRELGIREGSLITYKK